MIKAFRVFRQQLDIAFRVRREGEAANKRYHELEMP